MTAEHKSLPWPNLYRFYRHTVYTAQPYLKVTILLIEDLGWNGTRKIKVCQNVKCACTVKQLVRTHFEHHRSYFIVLTVILEQEKRNLVA